MKVTRAVIKDFETTQKHYGTKVAIECILWQTAAALYHDLGVTKITTVYKDVVTINQNTTKKKLRP